MVLMFNILLVQRWKATKDYSHPRDHFEIFSSVTPDVSFIHGVLAMKIPMRTMCVTFVNLSIKHLQLHRWPIPKDLTHTIDHLALLIVLCNLNPVLSVETSTML